jgi:hypothetical protein
LKNGLFRVKFSLNGIDLRHGIVAKLNPVIFLKDLKSESIFVEFWPEE